MQVISQNIIKTASCGACSEEREASPNFSHFAVTLMYASELSLSSLRSLVSEVGEDVACAIYLDRF